MIEQTELVVSKWQYQPPVNGIEDENKLTGYISLDVKKKRAATKKGIACRFSCEYIYEKELILEFIAEDSYVIDLEDIIDKNELQTMLRNSYSKFKDKYDFRKLGTVLQEIPLMGFDEKKYDLDPILLLLE